MEEEEEAFRRKPMRQPLVEEQTEDEVSIVDEEFEKELEEHKEEEGEKVEKEDIEEEEYNEHVEEEESEEVEEAKPNFRSNSKIRQP
jgi:hypothetical protein